MSRQGFDIGGKYVNKERGLVALKDMINSYGIELIVESKSDHALLLNVLSESSRTEPDAWHPINPGIANILDSVLGVLQYGT